MINFIKQAAGLLGGAFKFFALFAIVVNIAYSALLCSIVLYLAGEQSTLKAILSLTTGIIFGCLAGTILAIKFSLVRTIRKIIEGIAPGKTILDALLKPLIKDSKKSISPSTIENTLNDIAKTLQPDLGSGSIADIATWLAGKINRILIWATVKVVVKQATKITPNGEEVDFEFLKEQLGGKIDDLILSFIRTYLARIAYALFSLLTSLALFAGYLIGKLSP